MREGEEALYRRIRGWGVAAAVLVATRLALSFGFASFAPLGLKERRELALLIRFVHALPIPSGMQDALDRYVSGASILADEVVRGSLLTGMSLGLLICFLAVLREVIRAETVRLEESRLLFRFGLLFAVLSMFSYPVFTTDFWLSVGWGRIIVAGENPYYAEMSRTVLEGLPISNWGDRMTYGPLWALVSGGVSWLAGGKEGLEFVLFKGILLAAWIGTLELVRRIASERSVRDGAVAVCIFGWIPMSTTFALAEGHNDVVMAAPLVLWLYFLSHKRYSLSVPALTASFLVKYVSAPLLAADFLAKRVLGKITIRTYVIHLIPSAVLAAVVFAIFVRGPDFLASAEQMRHWTFWTPSTALMELSEEMGFQLPGKWVDLLVLAGCFALVGFYFFRVIRQKTFQQFLALALAIEVSVLFALVGHVWPWFMLWALPLAAFTWRSPLAWFVLGLASLAPFLNLHWLIGTDWKLRPASGVMLYSMAALTAIWLYVRYRMPVRSTAESGRVTR